MNITLHLNDEDTRLIQNAAAAEGVSVNELAQAVLMEMIEDRLDLQDYHKALEEYHKNPVTYTLQEMKEEIFC